MDAIVIDLATFLAAADADGSDGKGHINFLTIPVGTVAAFLLGWLWYAVLGKAWMRLLGKTREELGKPVKAMITSFFMLFLISLSFYWLMQQIRVDDWADGAFLGLGIGLAFVATSTAINYAYQGRPFRLWLIDAGYLVAAFALIGTIMGAWQS